MLAIRYLIRLPRDYDMATIRRRIATQASALDDYHGLLFLAHCLTEAGVAGAKENTYAPFSVWSNTSRMGHFLWGGDGFRGIERDFGRPALDSWALTSVQFTAGALRSARYATLKTTTATAGLTLDEVATEHKASVSLAMTRKDTRASVRGVELSTGNTMAFTALGTIPRNPDGAMYEVAHVSVPGRDT